MDPTLPPDPDHTTGYQPQPSASGATLPSAPPGTMPPGGEGDGRPRVPGYEILAELGRGGMGVVYKARQVSLNRLVALKVILARGHAGAAGRARFRTEAEAVARLQHPHIVQVYELGECDGLPYLALEYCDGGTLYDRLRGTPLPPRDAATLVEQLAHAVQVAHAARVVHRDLKPANVLLAASRERERPEDPKPPVAHALGSPGSIPKITDFGLAKLLDGDGSGPTVTGTVFGTPSYMAPEQADNSKTAGPAADVYALGAILYECLTGRPPFLAATQLDTLLQVITEEPVPPARLNPQVPRDLETVCLKCLQKDRAKRYATAGDLADDLRRFLASEPVWARPVGALSRALKWTRRRPAATALVVVCVLATLTLLGVGLYFTDKLRLERDSARTAARETRRREYVLAMNQAQTAWEHARVDRMIALLEEQHASGEDSLRSFEWHYLWRLSQNIRRTPPLGRSSTIEAITYSPDGQRLFALGRFGEVAVWDADSLQLLPSSFDAHQNWSHSLAISPDGRRLATGHDNVVKLWDAASGKLERSIKVVGTAWSVALGTGDRLVTATSTSGSFPRQEVQLWDAATGREVWPLVLPGFARSVAFSPDGRRLATVGFSGLKVLDTDTGTALFSVAALQCGHVSFDPEGRRLALTRLGPASRTQEVVVLDATDGSELWSGQGHTEEITALVFSPDGRMLASTAFDNTVRLWDTATGQDVRRFRGRVRWYNCVAFRPGSRQLVAAGIADHAEVWLIDQDQEADTTSVQLHPTGVRSPFFPRSLAQHADCGLFIVTGPFGPAVLDGPTGRTLAGMPFSGYATAATFTPDGRAVAIGYWGGAVQLWDMGTKQMVRSFDGLAHQITALSFSADGRRLAAGSRADLNLIGNSVERLAGAVDQVLVWEVETGQTVRHLHEGMEEVNTLALNADGTRLVVGTGRLSFHLWNVEDGRMLHPLNNGKGPHNTHVQAAISRDGCRVALVMDTAVDDTMVFDAATGRRVWTLTGHTRGLRAVAFSPDGRRLATAGNDEMVKLWDLDTGKEVLSWSGLPAIVALAFTSDGHRLRALAADGRVRTWDATPLDPEKPGGDGR